MMRIDCYVKAELFFLEMLVNENQEIIPTYDQMIALIRERKHYFLQFVDSASNRSIAFNFVRCVLETVIMKVPQPP